MLAPASHHQGLGDLEVQAVAGRGLHRGSALDGHGRGLHHTRQLGVGLDHQLRAFDGIGRDQAGLAPQQDVVESIDTSIANRRAHSRGRAFQPAPSLGIQLGDAENAQVRVLGIAQAHVGTVANGATAPWPPDRRGP